MIETTRQELRQERHHTTVRCLHVVREDVPPDVSEMDEAELWLALAEAPWGYAGWRVVG